MKHGEIEQDIKYRRGAGVQLGTESDAESRTDQLVISFLRLLIVPGSGFDS